MFMTEKKIMRILAVVLLLGSTTVGQNINGNSALRGRRILVGDGYLDEYAISQQPIEP